MSLGSVYCEYDPLEEVWLGDCYPAEFYQGFDPEVRSVFERITDITRTDLNNFEQILKSLSIVVCRPVFTQVENFAKDWVGFATETVLEVNSLIINKI